MAIADTDIQVRTIASTIVLVAFLLFSTGVAGQEMATPPAGYRQIVREDGIRFTGAASEIDSLPDGTFHEEGKEFGIIGNDGKEIRIPLISDTVDHGRIQTKDFGILLEMTSGRGMGMMVFATEDQIQKLRALQSTGR